MAVGTKTKVFTHTIPGFPTLTTAVGKMVAMLDAALVNGFNQVSVTSIVVASGIATVTCAAAHNLVAVGGAGTASTGTILPVVKIEGADQAALNDEFRVTEITSTTVFKFAISIADVTATGTITSKYASMGWQIAYTDTNRRAYQQINPQGTRLYLYVDDNAVAGRAHVTMYETMSSINDTSGRAIPNTAQVSTRYLEWGYIVYSTETPKLMTIIGDDLLFYLLICRPTGSSYDGNNYVCCGFGDPISYVPNDTYGCALWGSSSIGSTAEDCFNKYKWNYNVNASADLWLAREYNNSSSAGVQFFNLWGYWSTGLKWPSLSDNSLMIQEVYLGEVAAAGQTVRGKWPGVYGFMHCQPHSNGDGGSLINNATGLTHLSSIGPIAERDGDTFLLHYLAGCASDQNPGYLIVFDGNGDWR